MILRDKDVNGRISFHESDKRLKVERLRIKEVASRTL